MDVPKSIYCNDFYICVSEDKIFKINAYFANVCSNSNKIGSQQRPGFKSWVMIIVMLSEKTTPIWKVFDNI